MVGNGWQGAKKTVDVTKSVTRGIGCGIRVRVPCY